MRRTFLSLAAAALIALVAGTPARAATLEINFTGLDLQFDGSTLFDATALTGGNLDPTESDALSLVEFVLDGHTLGSFTSDVYADLALFGVDPVPVGGGAVSAHGGGFDLFSTLGWNLRLDLTEALLFYSGSGFALVGAAVGEIFGQSLPFELLVDQPVDVVFVLTSLSNITDDGEFLTGLEGTGGEGRVTAAAVPEPATLLMLSAGLLGVSARLRRRAA